MESIDKRPNGTLSQIDQMEARKEQTKKEIQQLENRQKMLLNKISMDERKARTRRLIERGAILESMITSSETLTNEDIKFILTAALKSEAASLALISIRKRQSEAAVTEPEAAQGTEV